MTTRISGAKDSIEASLHDESKPWTPVLAWAEDKTGVKRLYVFTLAVLFLGLWLVFGYAAQLICNSIAFGYPAYASLKALETPQKGDDSKWLTYWVVFAFFSIIEYPTNMLLYWFPFYWLVKCVFFIWCFMPLENNGSVIIYNKLIRPQFIKHEGAIDNALSNATKAIYKKIADSSVDMATKSD